MKFGNKDTRVPMSVSKCRCEHIVQYKDRLVE